MREGEVTALISDYMYFKTRNVTRINERHL